MVNISAGGFAFESKSQEIINIQNQNISLCVYGFELLKDCDLKAKVIRVSEANGNIIIGCRFSDDNQEILEYVNKNHK